MFTFPYLVKARRLALGVGMDVQGVQDSLLALSGHLRGCPAQRPEFLQLLGAEQQVAIRPSHGTWIGTHLNETAPPGEDLHPISVVDGGNGRLSRAQLAAQIEGGGATNPSSRTGSLPAGAQPANQSAINK